MWARGCAKLNTPRSNGKLRAPMAARILDGKSLAAEVLSALKSDVARLAQRGQDGQHEQESGDPHQHRRQRAGHEHRPVTARDQERPPQVLFH